MADRVSTYSIGFVGDDSDLSRFLTSVKSQFRSTLADIETATKRIELFANLETQIAASHASLTKAKQDVDALTTAIAAANAAGSPTGELDKQLKAAQQQVASTTREFNNQVTAISKLQGQLSRAGVDTKNLASEQLRLADAQQKASAAATEQAAKQALGLRTLKDVTPEINRLHAAYNTLSVSGTLSVKELAAAQQQLQSKVAELRAGVTGVGSAAVASSPDLAAFFTRSILPALGITASLATVAAGIKDVIATTHQFEQGLAEIGTVTTLTKAQLDGLGQGARSLSVEIGIGVNDALKGLFELIRSGVPPENALDVLRVSALAAKAGLADVGTGVKVATLLIDNFGVSLNDLPAAFDKIIRGAKNGGATLQEFARDGGQLLSVAEAANVDFNELIATLTVVVNKTGNAEKGTIALTRVIAALNTSEARIKLRELGIEGDGLVDTLQKIGAKGLALGDILALGLSDKRSIAGLAALTRNSAELAGALDRSRNAAGTAADAVAKLYDTPQGRSDRFNAQLEEAELNLGKLVGSGSQLQVIATNLIGAFNALPAGLNRINVVASRSNSTFLDIAKAFFQTDEAAGVAKKAIGSVGDAANDTGDRLDRLKGAVDRANTTLKDFGARLTEDIQSFQAVAARDIADATTRADAQIAALDRSLKATAATAAATIQIQTKLAADRLAFIAKEEADITAAVELAVAAREKLQRESFANSNLDATKQAELEKKLAAESAQARIAALGPVLAQYQAHYAALITQEQGYAAKIQEIGQKRLSFNEGIEKALFDIRLQGLSVFDQYVAKVNETQRLITLASTAATDEASRKYAEQAIGLARELKKVVDQNGNVVITDLQAQQQSLGLVKKASDAYNGSLDKEDDLANQGLNATVKALAAVIGKLQELQARYDALKVRIAEGLDVRVSIDEISVRNAEATLRELTKDRTVRLKVETEPTAPPEGKGFEQYFPLYLPPNIPGLKQGGAVARGFAAGGLVSERVSTALAPEIVRIERRANGGYVGVFRAGALTGQFEQAPAVKGFASGGPVFRSWTREPRADVIDAPTLFASRGAVSSSPASHETTKTDALTSTTSSAHVIREIARQMFEESAISKVLAPTLVDGGSVVLRAPTISMPEIVRLKQHGDGGYAGVFRAGGFVGTFEQPAMVHGFASGGPVFQSRSWSQIPTDPAPVQRSVSPQYPAAKGAAEPARRDGAAAGDTPSMARSSPEPRNAAAVTSGPLSESSKRSISETDVVAVKKTAARMYDESVISKFVRRFASGGVVEMLASPSRIAGSLARMLAPARFASGGSVTSRSSVSDEAIKTDTRTSSDVHTSTSEANIAHKIARTRDETVISSFVRSLHASVLASPLMAPISPEIIRVEKTAGGYIAAFRAGGFVGEMEQPRLSRPAVKFAPMSRRFATGGAVETRGSGSNRFVAERALTPADRHYVHAPDAPARAFAAGGPVFRRQSWTRVPGIGDGDTVPALLDSGSFVMRKAAVQMYGDGVMAKLIRGYAGGGNVYTPTPLIYQGQSVFAPDTRTAYQQFYDKYNQPQPQSEYFGDIKPGTPESSRDVGEISAPNLPSDPKERERVILKYVGEVKTATFADNYSYWAPMVKALTDQVTRYEQIKTPENLDFVLQRARAIGLNLGLGKAQNTGKVEQVGFDVDGRRYHKIPGGYFGKAPAGLAGIFDAYDFYAEGGQVAPLAPLKPPSDVPAPTLPADPAERQRKILEYAQRVAVSAQSDGPAYWHDRLTTMAAAVKTFQAAPTDANLTVVLDRARDIGLNLGAPRGTHIGYDVDGRSWHQTAGSVNAPGALDRYATGFDFYAKGGDVSSSLSRIAEHWHASRSESTTMHTPAQQAARLFMAVAAAAAPVHMAHGGSTDTVPAMLTPGEYVFSVPAVKAVTQMFGGGFLDRLNSLQFSRESIDRMINLQPPRPQGFQYGGAVGNLPATSSAAPGAQSSGGDHYELHFHGFDQTNEWIDRTLIPRLQEKQRRSK